MLPISPRFPCSTMETIAVQCLQERCVRGKWKKKKKKKTSHFLFQALCSFLNSTHAEVASGEYDGFDPKLTFLTSGNSHAMSCLCTLLLHSSKGASTVLCDDPTYPFAKVRSFLFSFGCRSLVLVDDFQRSWCSSLRRSSRQEQADKCGANASRMRDCSCSSPSREIRLCRSVVSQSDRWCHASQNETSEDERWCS
jgi:hypothetical protein